MKSAGIYIYIYIYLFTFHPYYGHSNTFLFPPLSSSSSSSSSYYYYYYYYILFYVFKAQLSLGEMRSLVSSVQTILNSANSKNNTSAESKTNDSIRLRNNYHCLEPNDLSKSYFWVICDDDQITLVKNYILFLYLLFVILF